MPGPFDGAPADARALDRRDARGRAARRGAGAARRHAAQPRTRRHPQRLARGGCRSLRDALQRDVLGGRSRAVAAALRPARLERRYDARPGAGRALGAGPGPRRRRRRTRRARWATRWAPASRAASPTTRTSAAWSGWRRGSTPATRSPRWPARTSWPVTACATGSPRPAPARRTSSAPRPSPPAPSSPDMGAPVTTCCTGRAVERLRAAAVARRAGRAEDRCGSVE